MEKEIIKIQIQNELDVVLAYKRAMQLSEKCGLALANQTKFATAISEICRNVLEHVGLGHIKFCLVETGGRRYLEGVVSDRGRGIAHLPELLSQPQPRGSKGWGIYNSRKLVEVFKIQSSPNTGTRVQLGKIIGANHPTIPDSLIREWVTQFNHDREISPYAEIKNQNMQLIKILDQLRLKNIQTENQLEEIKRLNDRLQTSYQEINILLEERNVSNQELLATNKELDQFAHVVSHDLKSPLYNIIALSGIIEECLVGENYSEAITTVSMLNKQAQQLDKLISDILLYSTTGRHNLTRKEVNLNLLIQNLLGSFNISPNVQVTVQPNLPTLISEEIYLQQVFSNLIGNALKYTDSENGLIQVSCKQENNLLQFSVADNGPGIPLLDQERIFKIFETSSLHRNTSSGIGLSIVDKIIKFKGTAIWVESRGAGGATFKFTWPASEVLDENAAGI